MDDRSTILMIRYKARDGAWKRAHPARAANGRLKNGMALVDGQQTQVSQYCYQVRHYVNRKTKWTTVGTNAADAENQRLTIQQQVSIRAAAPEANLVVVEGPVRKTLKETAAEYLKMKEDSRHLEAAAQAKSVTREFIEVVKKSYVDEIKSTDFSRFHSALYKRKLSDRTVSNKHDRAASWLVYAGLDKAIIPAPRKYEESLPTIYERDQITSLLGAADDYMTMVINIAWKCGLRDQELMFLEFADINSHERTIRVRGKVEFNFKVKDSEQRDIPIMDDLYADLMAWKTKHPKQSLVLSNKRGKPNTHLLRTLKHVARSAGLNCGKCGGCKSSNKECENYTLHHFRRTYITTMLRKGWDLRTVQAWAGHSDLASTMRYLRPAAGDEVRAKLAAMEW